MIQVKNQVSVLRLIVPVALACLILSSHAISQGTPVDRSVTATVDRSVTFSAGSLAPGAASLRVRNQSPAAIGGSPRTNSPPSDSNSNPRSLNTQPASSIKDSATVRSSSSDPISGAHPDLRVPGALGFTSSLSVGWGSTMRITSGTKSPETSPIQMDEAGPVVEGIFAHSSTLFSGSRRRGFDFPSTGHTTGIRAGVSSAKAQTSDTRKGCKGNRSNCTAEGKKRQPKHSSGWDALRPEQNSK